MLSISNENKPQQKTLHPSAKETERVQKLRQEYWDKSLDVDNEFLMGSISP